MSESDKAVVLAVAIGLPLAFSLENSVKSNFLLSLLISAGVILPLFFAFRSYFRSRQKNDPS